MEFIKSFISHILAIIFFLAVMFLSITTITKEVMTHNTIYRALEESELLDEALKNNETLKNVDIPEELLNYVEIDDIIYSYITDKFLYEVGMINEEPFINRNLLNERLATGLENYIDDKINEYTGGINSFLKEAGIDLGIEDKVKEYIENNTSIDLSNNEIVKEEDLQSIYKYVDDTIIDIRESTYAFDIIDILNNKKYQTLTIAIIIGTLLLIALVNFNITSVFAYSIAPFIFTSIIYLLGYFATSYINFSGSFTARIINSLIHKVGVICFKYFIIFIVAAILCGVLYYIIKHLNIAISHKRGVATLDTVFDDYNSEEVVKKINEREVVKETDKKEKKKKRKNKLKEKKEEKE